MEELQALNNESMETLEDDIKAQEKLNQRREARRRKILENAKNRLERLNGRTTSTTTPTTGLIEQKHEHINGPTLIDNGEFSDPEVEPNIILPQQQLLQNEPPIDMGNLFSSFTSFTSFDTETTPQQKRHILLRSRLHLIISALVACIFTFIWRDSTTTVIATPSSIGFSIFLPAGLCVIIDLLFFREQQALNPIVNLVITMLNIRLPSQTKNILQVLSIIQSLIVDLGVFIFSFCIFSCSLVCINNHFIDLIVIK